MLCKHIPERWGENGGWWQGGDMAEGRVRGNWATDRQVETERGRRKNIPEQRENDLNWGPAEGFCSQTMSSAWWALGSEYWLLCGPARPVCLWDAISSYLIHCSHWVRTSITAMESAPPAGKGGASVWTRLVRKKNRLLKTNWRR